MQLSLAVLMQPILATQAYTFANDPAGAAAAIANHIVTDTQAKQEFYKWGYGQSIILDAMLLMASELPSSPQSAQSLSQWVNPELDYYLNTPGMAGYNVTHAIPLSPDFIGTAVGDHIGLYPHAYLHRATYYNQSTAFPPPPGYSLAKDIDLARAVLDEYVLGWKVRWSDGTISRDTAGDTMARIGWNNTGEHQYIWGDDGYMALVLPSRMVVAGLDSENGTYASFVAAQNMLMQKHLLDTSSGLFWHGADAKAGVHSCCKWGRANGWTLMSSAEVLAALYASGTPAAIAARPAALAAFQAHAAALTKVQNSDGRWHQVLDNQTTFLETSCTAMYTVAIVTGINAGWLDNATYSPVVVQAWAGLASVIHDDGYVDHICDGFGIHPTMESYEGCPQVYSKSHPGLGSVLKAAVLVALFLQK